MRAEEARRGLIAPAHIAALFDRQRAFVADGSKLKAVHCGRRAGKTTANQIDLIDTALRHPGVTCPYVWLTRPSAKRYAWDAPGTGLVALFARFGIKATLHHTDLTATFENGSRIFLVGADDAQAIERLRGGKFKRAVVEEAASFGPQRLLSLVREVLRPAMLDERGSITLSGTPGAACAGLFYEACVGKAKGFSVHRWTALENPYLDDPKAYLDEERRINGWRDDHPTYRREYLGEWVRDAGGLVYPFDAARNGIDRAPEDIAVRVLGIDYGFGNATAFVVWGYRAHDPTTYVLWSAKQSGLTPDAAARFCGALQTTWGEFARMVGDVGGLGKGYAEEARQRFALAIEPAAKADKRAVQELAAGDLLSGRIKIVMPTNAALLDEMAALQWNADRSTEDDRFENDLCDAFLYGWRATKAWAADHEPRKQAPKPEAEEMFDRTMREAQTSQDEYGFDSW